MSKFNKVWTIKQNLASRPDVVLNKEDELAWKLDPLTNLYLKAVTSFVSEPKYYEEASKADQELLNAIYEAGEIDPEFVLQLAISLREKMYLRSVPLVILTEFANQFPGTVKGARKYVTRCIQRADEITELLALQYRRNRMHPRITTPTKSRINQEDKNKRPDKQTPVPMMLKEGIAEAFNKFNEYNLSKYNRDGAVKLRDALFVSHPFPKDEAQQEIFNKIAKNTLAIPETWEVMRSTGKMNWHEVVNKVFYKDGKINNYMAQLKNIRNVMKDPSVTKADVILLSQMLSNKEAVLKSKQFPYRFLSAYLVAQDIESPYTNMILDALETAVLYSTENIPKLYGLTVIANDFSGSMRDTLTSRTKNYRESYDEKIKREKYELKRCDIGELLGMIANTFCQISITGIFGDTWKVIPTSKHTGILNTTVQMRKKAGQIVGCSTNGYLVPQYLLEKDIKADRIMVFTDGQLWNSNGDGIHFASEFLKYQRKYPQTKLYLFDLAGYGTMVIPQDTKNVVLIGGWSDGVFKFIPSFEEVGKSNIIETIKNIKVN